MKESVRRMLMSVGLVAAWLAFPGAGLAQEAQPDLVVELGGAEERLEPSMARGYAAVPLEALARIGWSVPSGAPPPRLELRAPDGATVHLTVGSPFLHWGERAIQLADAPYVDGTRVWVPLQLLVDILPERMPAQWVYQPDASLLRFGGGPAPATEGTGAPHGRSPRSVPGAMAGSGEAPEADASPPAATTSPAAPRLVVIDAGHGGADPGAIGAGGIREKDVALGISRRLADILERRADVEVHMTRTDDSFVEVWDRGLLATELKGERPGVFVSIHANSFPQRRAARGFETYFLSDARTEHERRVAAIENAPLSIRGRAVDVNRESDLDFIFRELRNFDHAHWSALLAQMVQDELRTFHPGPDRGVKQGPLAVLTNALMPAVLIEIGYLSNQEEGRLIAQEDFQRRSAEAIANAILSFFERYPPGTGAGEPR